MAHQLNDNYIISRDASEAERLDAQHRLILSCQGYYLHPNIPLSSSSPRIADLGTGTSLWLRELATTKQELECHGFDISDAMFPGRETLPSNVELHTADMKEPFEEKWRGYFDVVHVRLVQAAIKEENEWDLMLRNVIQLLKPGGWLQWVESDRAVSVRHALRPVAPPLATTYRPPNLEHLASLNRSIMPDARAQAMNHGFMNLDVLMARENLQDVLCDGYVLDRQDDGGKFRSELADLGIVTVRSMLKARGEEEAREEWAEKAREEVERGAHFVTRMKVFVGRKGLNAV